VATPIGHALAGWAIHSWWPGDDDRRRALWFFALTMAVLPDLDILPGVLSGAPVLYHQGISHSLGAAVVAGLLASIVAPRVGLRRPGAFFLGLACYGSHLALDFFGPDGRPPYGIPIFWPLSDQVFISARPFLPGVRHARTASDGMATFVSGLLQRDNLYAIVLEFAILFPFLLGGLVFRRKRRADRRL